MPIEVLPSSRHHAASKNLGEFVRRAREDVAAFGRNLDFDLPTWDVTEHKQSRVTAANRKKALIYFTALSEDVSTAYAKGRIPLSEPFASFMRALVRMREESKPKAAQNHMVVVRAGRYLHAVLAEKGHDPCQLTASDFYAAAALCRRREKESSRYRIGLALIEIAGTMNRYGISKVRIDLRNPFPRVVHDDTRIGTESEKRRMEKLPGEAALDALAQIANLVQTSADVLRMRCIELLVCGGWRINELLTLPEDCEVAEPAFENGEAVLGPDGSRVQRYGIRYFAEKGGGPSVKWIPTAMTDVARRAVADLRLVTAGARDVARWLDANPGRAYLPASYRNRDMNDLFSMKDVDDLFNLTRGGGFSWCRCRKLPLVDTGYRVYVRRGDLESALLAEQPQVHRGGLPLKLHEYLFLMHMNECQEDRATNPCVVEFLSDGRIADFLAGRGSKRGRTRSVFERFGFAEPDGRPIELTSHMFRHWLNTLAQRGGMGQHEIARWSGRKDIGQNAAYDHVSGIELAEKVRGMVKAGQVKGPIADIHGRLPPIERAKFCEAQFATAHTTDIGMCVNDWSLAPCPNHGSCASCGDHLVEKGNREQRARAEVLLEEHEFLLRAAEHEAQEGTYGASNYVAHNRRMVDGLERIIAVHDDPAIPDGTLVQANPSSSSLYANRTLDQGESDATGQ